jgi:hypothetical protein
MISIVHKQYTENSLVLIENNDLEIANSKCLLLCCGAMSGLKKTSIETLRAESDEEEGGVAMSS